MASFPNFEENGTRVHNAGEMPFTLVPMQYDEDDMTYEEFDDESMNIFSRSVNADDVRSAAILKSFVKSVTDKRSMREVSANDENGRHSIVGTGKFITSDVLLQRSTRIMSNDSGVNHIEGLGKTKSNLVTTTKVPTGRTIGAQNIMMVGIRGKPSYGAVIIAHDYIYDITTSLIPANIMITVIRSGNTRLTPGQYSSVDQLQRAHNAAGRDDLVTSRIRTRNTIFRTENWIIADDYCDEYQCAHIVLQPWANRVSYARDVIEANLLGLSYDPFESEQLFASVIALPPVVKYVPVSNTRTLTHANRCIHDMNNATGTLSSFRTSRAKINEWLQNDSSTTGDNNEVPRTIPATSRDVSPNSSSGRSSSIRRRSKTYTDREVLTTRIGTVAIYFGSYHGSVDFYESEFSIDTAVYMLRDCMRYCPRIIRKDSEILQPIQFIVNLWRFLRAKCPEIAYSVVGLMCMCDTDCETSFEGIAMRMVCSSLMTWRGKSTIHVPAQDCIAVILHCYHSSKTRISIGGTESKNFVHIVAGAIWNSYYKNNAPWNKYGPFIDLGNTVVVGPKDTCYELNVGNYTTSSIVRELHRSDQRLISFEDTLRLNSDKPAMHASDAVICNPPVICPVARAVEHVHGQYCTYVNILNPAKSITITTSEIDHCANDVMSYTCAHDGTFIARENMSRVNRKLHVHGELVPIPCETPVTSSTISRAYLYDQVDISHVTWFDLQIVYNVHEWHFRGMNAPAHHMHVRIRELLHDALSCMGIFAREKLLYLLMLCCRPDCDTIINAEHIERAFRNEICDVLFLLSWIVSGAICYIGNGVFKVVNVNLMYVACADAIHNQIQIHRHMDNRGAFTINDHVKISSVIDGPFISVLWYHDADMIDYAIRWAGAKDATIFCPIEAVYTISFKYTSDRVIHYGELNGGFLSSRWTGKFVIIEPSRIGPVSKSILLQKLQYCQGIVLGEFVSNINDWIPWLQMTMPPYKDPKERLMQCSTGTVKMCKCIPIATITRSLPSIHNNPTAISPHTPIGRNIGEIIAVRVRELMMEKRRMCHYVYANGNKIPTLPENRSILIVVQHKIDLYAAYNALFDFNPSIFDCHSCESYADIVFIKPDKYCGFPLLRPMTIVSANFTCGYKYYMRCCQAGNFDAWLEYVSGH